MRLLSDSTDEGPPRKKSKFWTGVEDRHASEFPESTDASTGPSPVFPTETSASSQSVPVSQGIVLSSLEHGAKCGILGSVRESRLAKEAGEPAAAALLVSQVTTVFGGHSVGGPLRYWDGPPGGLFPMGLAYRVNLTIFSSQS